MSGNHPHLLPIIDEIVTRAGRGGFSFTPGTHVVAVQHLVPDILQLFGGLIALGVPPQNIFVLGKIYSNVPTVIQRLRLTGLNVYPTTPPPLGDYYPTFESDIEGLWAHFERETAGRAIDELIVLDDGGMLMTAIPDRLLDRAPVAGEEQTTSGLYHFEDNRPRFDVVSEASAAVKRVFESPLFTAAAVQRVVARYGGLTGQNCGIVGLGAIGCALARELSSQGNRIMSYDLARCDLAAVPGHARCDSFAEMLERSDYLFGCTGRDLFTGMAWPLPYRDGLTLVSVSSGDREFLSLIRQIRERGNWRFEGGRGDVSARSRYGRLRILQQGFPINFDGTMGSAPARVMQLTAGMLLGGAIQAAIRLRAFPGEAGRVLMHSPAFQRWLLARWVNEIHESRTLYEPELLDRSRHRGWYVEHSGGEPDDDGFFEMMVERPVEVTTP